jgi:hypothetical protein
MLFNTFTIRTKYSTSVICRKLTDGTITSSKIKNNPPCYGFFRGRVSESSFKLSLVGDRGSLTNIIGRFEVVPEGTIIHIVMYPVPIAILIMLCFTIVPYRNTLEHLSKIITEINLSQLSAVNIIELVINGIGILMPIVAVVLFNFFAGKSELNSYQTKLAILLFEDTSLQ